MVTAGVCHSSRVNQSVSVNQVHLSITLRSSTKLSFFVADACVPLREMSPTGGMFPMKKIVFLLFVYQKYVKN